MNKQELAEKIIEEQISLMRTGMNILTSEEEVRRIFRTLLVPEFKTIQVFALCDYLGIGFSEIKARILRDIQIAIGEQYEKKIV